VDRGNWWRPSGVGEIARVWRAAKADIILIQGHNGGNGCIACDLVKYAGCQWEMGLTEAHQGFWHEQPA